MDILRITTAGSVDDGKSTLIGRLLFDTRSVPMDKIAAIEAASQRKGLDFTDLSLLTDGLIAEREQGITIDVAYIYFSTPTRKFIIADSPGHVEYTRNMITGASTASVFLILVDARHGITTQTRRHFYIASLLGFREVAVCINKMDLVDYNQQRYQQIMDDFHAICRQLELPGQDIIFIPMSAREGENVVDGSTHMNWCHGPSLLEFLEGLNPRKGITEKPVRLSIQYVIRTHHPDPEFRGYAGRLTSGNIKIGDELIALPGNRLTRIKSLRVGEEERRAVVASESLVLELEEDIDISRGNMLAEVNHQPLSLPELNATICWMSQEGLVGGRTYYLQHGTNRVKAKCTRIISVLDIDRMEQVVPETDTLALNEIGITSWKLAKPIFADRYAHNPANGNFIVIDEFSNETVGVGIIT